MRDERHISITHFSKKTKHKNNKNNTREYLNAFQTKMWRYDLDKFGVKLLLPVERFRYSERYWTVGRRKMGFQSSSWGPKEQFF